MIRTFDVAGQKCPFLIDLTAMHRSGTWFAATFQPKMYPQVYHTVITTVAENPRDEGTHEYNAVVWIELGGKTLLLSEQVFSCKHIESDWTTGPICCLIGKLIVENLV